MTQIKPKVVPTEMHRDSRGPAESNRTDTPNGGLPKMQSTTSPRSAQTEASQRRATSLINVPIPRRNETKDLPAEGSDGTGISFEQAAALGSGGRVLNGEKVSVLGGMMARSSFTAEDRPRGVKRSSFTVEDRVPVKPISIKK